MLSPKKLMNMVRKWQRVAALKRKRLMISTDKKNAVSDEKCFRIASKGHVFVYTIDERRFMIPLKYLTNTIFMELFRISEEQFGLPSDGPITLPCEGSDMEYIMSLFQGKVITGDVEKALLHTIASRRCVVSSTSCLCPEKLNLSSVVYGF